MLDLRDIAAEALRLVVKGIEEETGRAAFLDAFPQEPSTSSSLVVSADRAHLRVKVEGDLLSIDIIHQGKIIGNDFQLQIVDYTLPIDRFSERYLDPAALGICGLVAEDLDN